MTVVVVGVYVVAVAWTLSVVVLLARIVEVIVSEVRLCACAVIVAVTLSTVVGFAVAVDVIQGRGVSIQEHTVLTKDSAWFWRAVKTFAKTAVCTA